MLERIIIAVVREVKSDVVADIAGAVARGVTSLFTDRPTDIREPGVSGITLGMSVSYEKFGLVASDMVDPHEYGKLLLELLHAVHVPGAHGRVVVLTVPGSRFPVARVRTRQPNESTDGKYIVVFSDDEKVATGVQVQYDIESSEMGGEVTRSYCIRDIAVRA